MNTPSATSLLVPLRHGDNVVCLEVCLFSANNVEFNLVFIAELLNLCYKNNAVLYKQQKGCTRTTFLKHLLYVYRFEFV